MPRLIKVYQKKRGRPATGRDPVITVRLPLTVISSINRFAAEKSVSRSEAVRQLLEKELARRPAKRPPNKETAHKASKLAAREIEPLGDKSMPPEEQARRKRALISGPKEFREIRDDLPKTKG
jgi:hypothetical protein